MAEVRYEDGRLEHPSVRREQSDVKLGPIAGVVLLVGLALLSAGLFALWVLAHKLNSPPVANRLQNYSEARVPLPAPPRLDPIQPQNAHATSYAGLYEQMETRLHQYGPSEEAGFVHISIDEAMRQTANTLRIRAEPGEQNSKSRGLVTSGDANSGRVFLGEMK